MFSRQKFFHGVAIKLTQQNVNPFTYEINVSVKFAAVSLPVCKASKALKEVSKTHSSGICNTQLI